jgi:hypothetical protein
MPLEQLEHDVRIAKLEWEKEEIVAAQASLDRLAYLLDRKRAL